VKRPEEKAEEPTDRPQPTSPPVEPADTLAVPNEMNTPLNDEEIRVVEDPLVPMDHPPHQRPYS